MSLANYSDLKSAVASWILRSNLTAQIPDFIRLAEATMDQKLRCREMRTFQNFEVGPEAQTIAIPSTYLEMIQIQPIGTWELDDDDNVVVEGVSGLPALQLRSYAEMSAYDERDGQPLYYCEVPDGDYWYVWPAGQYQLKVFYYRTVPTLSDAAPTNDILTNHPDLYLSGAMVEAENFLKIPPLERGPWGPRFSALIEHLNTQMRVSEYSGATLRTRTAYGNR